MIPIKGRSFQTPNDRSHLGSFTTAGDISSLRGSAADPKMTVGAEL
ncbi:MAG: hypothetical protein IID40_03080 [Planctomycetes bacterium]|nr:hypothetical protein [Planctomycetota bacterium]